MKLKVPTNYLVITLFVVIRVAITRVEADSAMYKIPLKVNLYLLKDIKYSYP